MTALNHDQIACQVARGHVPLHVEHDEYDDAWEYDPDTHFIAPWRTPKGMAHRPPEHGAPMKESELEDLRDDYRQPHGNNVHSIPAPEGSFTQ